jgi:hypothetical protein
MVFQKDGNRDGVRIHEFDVLPLSLDPILYKEVEP